MPNTPRLAIVAWAAICSCAEASEFPYTAHVTADNVDVRSGPGEKYYPVLKLEHGQPVEVYRHDPGGWCAIRPPEGAFSWVSAEFIEPGEGDVGVVSGDRVMARVGSKFDDKRDVIQVRLDRGEEVRILGIHEFDSSAGVQTWYKIAPPAGEFRWISGRDVERPSKKRSRRRWEDVDGADETKVDNDDVQLVGHEEPGRQSADRGRKHRESDDDFADEGEDRSHEDVPLPGPVRSYLLHRQPKAQLKEEAVDLDLALSAIVAEETSQWDFTLLRRQADAALARAETAVERGHIRRVLRKLDNFAEIQQRYAAVMRNSDRSGRGDRVNWRPGALDSASLSLGQRAGESRFDGEGRLTQITTADPRAPQFALIDPAGQVSAYVSPAPGVNLRRYLNRDVGIHGTRGYLADRQARHLTARRIETLGDSRLR